MVLGAAAVLLCLGSACRVFPEWESVTVRPPKLPAAWSDCGLAPAWEIRAVWSGGEARVATVPDSPARLILPRRETVAILAYPIRSGRALRPAGAVYPSDGWSKPILTWEGGYRAETVRILILAGVDPSRFDLERFYREAFARLGDPWLRPPAGFAESFVEETFRVTWLDPDTSWIVQSPVLPGPAASESPFGPGLVPDGEGRAAIVLPRGVHRWYAGWGRVSVEVQEGKEAVWAVTANSGQ